MTQTNTPAKPKARRPRVLWANAACLLDTSSGASMSVREILMQLNASMVDVRIFGATNFDSERGTDVIKSYPQAHGAKPGDILSLKDGPLVHNLFVTTHVRRSQMTTKEEMSWHIKYAGILASFRPDLVFFYGGQTLDYLISDEARVRGIPSAAYLANANYHGTRWCRDVDLILTDSEATAGLYAERHGLLVRPIGKFINQDRFVSPKHTRRNVLFVNPSLEKGAGIVLRLAAMLKQRRSDILIEVLESRGRWQESRERLKAKLGPEVADLPNVTVTPHVSDMRPVYGRARVLLAPSLWWESAARVLAESLLNGIPCIVTNRGGSAEMVGNAGAVIDLEEKYFKKPYTLVPDPSELEPFASSIIEMYDNEAKYQTLVEHARKIAAERHHISISTRRVIAEMAPLWDRRAGDGDFEALEVQHHRHKLYTLQKPKGGQA